MILCFQLCGNSLGKGPFLFQHDNAPMHKVRSIQRWFVVIGVEELDWPGQSTVLNPIEHLWDELERRLRARPNRPTSVPDLTNALVAEWKQIPAAIFQHLVESLPRRVEAVIAAKGTPTPSSCPWFWNEMLTEQVPTYFWPFSVHTNGIVICVGVTRVKQLVWANRSIHLTDVTSKLSEIHLSKCSGRFLNY